MTAPDSGSRAPAESGTTRTFTAEEIRAAQELLDTLPSGDRAFFVEWCRKQRSRRDASPSPGAGTASPSASEVPVQRERQASGADLPDALTSASGGEVLSRSRLKREAMQRGESLDSVDCAAARSTAGSDTTDWAAWKRHLIVCADCTAGDECAEGKAILGRNTADDAPWLVAAGITPASRVPPAEPERGEPRRSVEMNDAERENAETCVADAKRGFCNCHPSSSGGCPCRRCRALMYLDAALLTERERAERLHREAQEIEAELAGRDLRVEERESRLAALQREQRELLKALEEISRGMGAFSLDPLTHAENTIDDMKRIAVEALAAARRSSGRTDTNREKGDG